MALKIPGCSVYGGQFEYLARFADEMGTIDLEIEKSAVAADVARAVVKDFVGLEPRGIDSCYRMADSLPNLDLELFKNSRFPVSVHLCGPSTSTSRFLGEPLVNGRKVSSRKSSSQRYPSRR